LVLGHGNLKYKVNQSWGVPADKSKYPVKDCHEMVIDSKGRIILLTNHPKNNILIYDKLGNVLESWTLNFESAHGLTIDKSGSEDYLFICDYKSQKVVKTTLTGKVVLTFPTPSELGIYKNPKNYLPTHTAIGKNGDVYVADGYGSSFVIQFKSDGSYIRHFGGRGKEEGSINCAHGIAIDTRNEIDTLLVSSREDACFKRYTLQGEYLEAIRLDGAFACRPVIHKENLYAAVCWSNRNYYPNTGFVLILDKENQAISSLGGNLPNKTERFRQTHKVFKHCHDVCIDEDDDIYVCQWNAGGIYPFKLERI
jgi:DNA-binding beta-propeller fold protein YncE